MKTKTNIKWSPYVIGCNIGGTIYLHPRLPEYPKLFNKVLEHEKNHTSGYSHKDFLHDLVNNELKGVKKDYYKFLFKHPKALVGLLPLMRLDKSWVFDLNILLVYLLGGITALALFVALTL